ncbi:MAG: dephospho-CoA kinase [Verrucomicrobiota bacterium]
MPTIGITGGIATGKTSFCECLRELVPYATFFNADQAARELTDNDAEVRAEIAREFGRDIYSASGDLNRAAMRSIVFADAEKKRALEQILHPRIRRQWSDESQRHASDLFFADIPLLYETSGESLCDRTVVVACAPGVQRERLMARTGLAQAEVAEMIEAQMPLEEKMRRADHVVWNNGGREVLREQARLLVGLWREELWKKK